jgi:glutaminyl-peptide cyclotransferase
MVSPDPAGAEMMRLVEWQVGFGPRYPGAPGHGALLEALQVRLGELGLRFLRQEFTVTLEGRQRECANLVVRLGAGQGRPLLLGTHWDSRLIADREPDARRRGRPIPGANDGGSGTAVELVLLRALRELRLRREVQVAFFDAEDVGNIEGNEFSMGARYLAAHPVGERPVEVVALDMVGGRDMVLDRDAHASGHRPTWELTRELFAIGGELGLRPFTASKPAQWKYIVSDHHPFLAKGIPAAILIDIDYPPWHTHGDLPGAMAADSLAAVLQVVATWVERVAA